MKGFDPKYKNFPDYILKITKQFGKIKMLSLLVNFIAIIFQLDHPLVSLMEINL